MKAYIIIYFILLACYFHTRTEPGNKYRAINKYAMATMYLALAFYFFIRKQDFSGYRILLMVAIIFAWLGDIFLVLSFTKGGIFFMIGNICFTVFQQMTLRKAGYQITDYLWAYIIAVIIIAGFIVGCQFKPKVFKLGKMRLPMTAYLSTITIHGLTGLAMMTLLPSTSYALMGTGSVLFLISDIILITYKFILGENKWLIRANSLTYFTGLLLIVLSTK